MRTNVGSEEIWLLMDSYGHVGPGCGYCLSACKIKGVKLSVGDEISEAMLYPVAHRLIAKCDAIYRIAGASKGADMDIEVARKYGLKVYTALENIPEA